MGFKYHYRVKTSDLWQASMYYSYSSFMGIVNLVCIASAIALIVSRWSSASDLFRTVMLLFLLVFTVFQPLIIWLRARASLDGVYPELELAFSQAGITIGSDGKKQQKQWKSVRAIVKKPTILLIYMEDGNGYILRNSVLKETKKELYDYVSYRINEARNKDIKNN